MSFDLDPLYVFYALAGLAAVLAAEGIYLFFATRRTTAAGSIVACRCRRRSGDREKVLVQLRRERGLTADGDAFLPVAWFNRLVTQSGIKVSVPRALGAMIAGAGSSSSSGSSHGASDPRGSGDCGARRQRSFSRSRCSSCKRKRRHAAFAARFPDAIDIIVRSLRAGHPVPVAISMVGRELPDPVGTEFGMVADEITYGADIETALRNMMRRVGQEDLPLFVTSVAHPEHDGRQPEPDPGQPLQGHP